MATTRPDRHTQRYDRQLRLWNKSGQSALENAKVLVVGASPFSSQILKNLVLPGLGHFTILDDKVVNESDVGTNFFLQADESLNRPYAREIATYLAELNPNVQYDAEIQPRQVQERIADIGWNAQPSIPVLCAQTSGFQGAFHLSVRELGIIETHPESLTDLRLTNPFQELLTFASQFNLDTEDSLERSHIPYVVLLLRALQDWKSEHGKFPSPAERREFLDYLRERRPEGDSENFDEAQAALAQHVWRPLQSAVIPTEVSSILNDDRAKNVSENSTVFWLLVAALRQFTEKELVLPLTGSVPDMKSSSGTYVALQRIYLAKAQRDFDVFQTCLDDVLTRSQLTREQTGLDENYVRTFTKHTAFLHLVRGRRLIERRTDPDTDAIKMAFADPVNPTTVQYLIAFAASDAFYSKHGHFPTEYADSDNMVKLAHQYIDEIGLDLSEDEMSKVEEACIEMYVQNVDTVSVVRSSTWHLQPHYWAELWLKRRSRSLQNNIYQWTIHASMMA
ncbi:hypothetical protein MPSI1_000864 [Malassezia psittaci]|uniref:NEDD8-activating enzyme E1 regulatory subunit n=1 Tax=Malassezia psittaci TaxID=1821823 RepID=A0AAF0JD21_9BASI|nr:hypothetical protein MPSI1_000864 [Malassezia psittaci]